MITHFSLCRVLYSHFTLFLFANQLQYTTTYRMYNTLTERCFQTCVSSFRSKSLDKYETTCVENCAERYIKMTQRVGLRFAEDQALRQKRAADAAAGGR